MKNLEGKLHATNEATTLALKTPTSTKINAVALLSRPQVKPKVKSEVKLEVKPEVRPIAPLEASSVKETKEAPSLKRGSQAKNFDLNNTTLQKKILGTIHPRFKSYLTDITSPLKNLVRPCFLFHTSVLTNH